MKSNMSAVFGGGLFAISLSRVLGASPEVADLIGLPAIPFFFLLLEMIYE